MGSFIEINDTLRISKSQGFPIELDILKHMETPFNTSDFEEKVFNFKAKPKIRVYKIPPVRNFLVEDLDGKWIYWGLCYITSIKHNYEKQETSGTFKIIKINSPEEMRQMFDLTHFTNKEQNYF